MTIMATNIFYRIPSQTSTRVISLPKPDNTLDKFCNFIIESEKLDSNDFIIACGTKVFKPNSCGSQNVSLQNNTHIDILIPILGGKGGFGSLLRAIGAQIEKTTNRDACRDLSGRRLRDVKREDELKKLLLLRDKLEEERKRRKKEKLEKLKRKTTEDPTANTSIQELVQMFDDNAYNRRRLEIGDIIDAAVEKGVINFKKRQREELETQDEIAKKSKVTDEEEKSISGAHSEESTSKASNKCLSKERTSQLEKQDIWLGLESDSDDARDESAGTSLT